MKANFRSLGRRFGKGTQPVAAAIAAADPVALTASLRGTGSATVVVARRVGEHRPDDVVITETPREGWAVATDAGETLALDLHLTPDLIPPRTRTRGGPAGPGGAQVRGARGQRPNRAAAVVGIRRTVRGPRRALRRHRQRGPGRLGVPGRGSRDAVVGTDADLGITFALRRA